MHFCNYKREKIWKTFFKPDFDRSVGMATRY